ncbi:MAG TPA: TonB-dependent receptor [Rhodospirillaceae bacterium]|nr:TonB-dependent receptor [Rhodospirillaceae bacterium]
MAADGSVTSGLETVTITAQRQTKNLQETPVAISAISGEEFQQQGAETVRDLVGTIPNFYIQNSGVSSIAQLYSIRGVGEWDPMANPSIAVYVDDVYIPRTLGAMFDLTDLRRVEVLRGPQGTLYGRNTVAGAIRYITDDPTDTPHLSVSAGFGNYNDYETHDFVSGPIIPGKLYGNLAYTYRSRDGWLYAPNQGKDVNGVNQQSARGKLRLEATEDLSFETSFDGSWDVSGWNFSSLRYRPSVDPTSTTLAERDTFGKLLLGGFSFKATYRLDDHTTAKSITAYRGYKDAALSDNDATQLVLNENAWKYFQQNVQQEFQLNGKYDRLSYTSGLFFYHENYVSQRDVFGTNSAAKTYAVGQYGDLKTDSVAAYGQAEAKLIGDLSGVLGVRLTHEEGDFGYNYFVENGAPPAAIAKPFVSHARHDWYSASPKIGLQYQWTPDAMQYISYSEGQKAGGYDNRAGSIQGAGIPFGPETSQTYEAGLKTEWLDHRARANFAVFYNDYTNFQANVQTPWGYAIRESAGRAHTEGFEVETSVKPIAGLQWDNNFGYLLAIFDQFDNPGSNVQGVAVASVKGNALQYAPRWNATSRIAYDLPVNFPGAVRAEGDVELHTKAYSDVFNSRELIVPFQTIFNASLGYTTEDDHWSVNFSLRNLLDKQSVQTSNAYKYSPTGQTYFSGMYNTPRMVLLTLRYRY